jgi:MFS family permease
LPGQHAGTALATVAAFTYCGSIISPPLIGGMSDAFQSLRWALFVDAILLALVIPFSYGVPQEDVINAEKACSSDDDENVSLHNPLLLKSAV